MISRVGKSLISVLCVAFTACGGCEKEEPAPGSGELESRGLALTSAGGCSIDADCVAGKFCFQHFCAYECTSADACSGAETCSERGRCLAGGETDSSEALIETAPGVLVVERPETIFKVSEADSSVVFSFKISGKLPEDRLSYRLIRSDDGGNPSALLHAPVADGRINIEIPFEAEGRATLFGDDAAGVLQVKVATTIGDFDVLVLAAANLDGEWAGRLSLQTFGGQKFDFELTLVGDTLDGMRVLLPSEGRSVFAPREDYDEDRGYEVADLEFNPAVGTYQAIFKNEYRFDSDVGGLFEDRPLGNIERTIRLDFDADALESGAVEGSVSDTWRGLYDAQTQAGAESVSSLRFLGRFAMERQGNRPADLRVTDSTADAAVPKVLDHGGFNACTDADFTDVPDVDVDGTTYSCAGVTSLAGFESAAPLIRAQCAVALARNALSGNTTEAQLVAALGDPAGAANAESLEDFLSACADVDDPICSAAAGAHCAFELTTAASTGVTLANLGGDAQATDALLSDVLAAMSETASETFLAPQLGAFYNDLRLKTSWLENSGAPEVFLSAVAEKNLELMEVWRLEVLDVQRGVFVQFFQRDALTLLGRQVQGAAANERRVKLLSEAGVLWLGYSSALTLAADRWATIIEDEADRAAKVEYVQARTIELYLVMGMLIDFNRAAEANFEGASLAQGFSQLTQSLDRLATPHRDALFARDGEVVTARSLDPQSSNASLLSERKERAEQVTQESLEAINEILRKAKLDAIDREFLEGRLETEAAGAAKRVYEICGLPSGCDVTRLQTDRACYTMDLGICGLVSAANPETGDVWDRSLVARSEAGRAVLAIIEAQQTADIEAEESTIHTLKLELDLTALEAYKADLDSWHEARLANSESLEKSLADREAIRDKGLKELTENLAARATKRAELLGILHTNAAQWNTKRVNQVETTYRESLRALLLTQEGVAASSAADLAAAYQKAQAEALPKSAGASTDTTSVARAAFFLAGDGLKAAGSATKAAFDALGKQLELRAKNHADETAAELTNLAAREGLEKAKFEQAIAALNTDLETSKKTNEDDVARLAGVIELANRQLELEEVWGRDYDEWRQRKNEYDKASLDTSAKLLRVTRADFWVAQKTEEYHGLVFEAELEKARLSQIRQQQGDLNRLTDGAAEVFARSYALDRAEDLLAVSRQALMDWLVVIEYYAVRPFIAQRNQILLARNAFQLDTLIRDLTDLTAECGGAERSHATETLSLRQDILGLTRGLVDDATDAEITADQRFQMLMHESFVPASRLVRYSTETTLQQVLEGTGTLALPFTIHMDAFGNLALACNAKIERVSVQLVGAIGDGEPTVTLIYDGVSQLRSCQPEVDDYVAAFALGSSYGSVSLLRTDGRAMSPPAGVNKFIADDDQENKSLSGLPVASDYTLLIDTSSTANAQFDWDKLEDVIIQIDYSYQDLFPTSCD